MKKEKFKGLAWHGRGHLWNSAIPFALTGGTGKLVCRDSLGRKWFYLRAREGLYGQKKRTGEFFVRLARRSGKHRTTLSSMA